MNGIDSYPRLSIIIVTFNSAAVVPDALRRLPSDVEVIVVDNASSDDTVKIVGEHRPDARLVQSATNDGFARAVNRGAELALSRTLLLLNPDAVIDDDAIAKVMAVLNGDDSIGAAAPLVVEGHGGLATLAAGFEPTIWRMSTHSSGLSRLAGPGSFLRGHYLMRRKGLDTPLVEVDWLSGGCLFVKRSVWEQLGGLTERWFMYAEDVEFGLRVGDSGRRSVLVTGATATHTVGASSTGSERVRTNWLENLFDLYQARYRAGLLRRAAWRGIVAAGYTARLVASRANDTLHRRGPSHDAHRFAAYALAALRAQPMRSDITLQRAGDHSRTTHASEPARIARFYPVARTAHLERLESMLSGDFFYTSTRRDWNDDLARRTAGVERVTLGSLLRRIWIRDYDVLEIPEPYAIALLPHASIIALTVKLKRWSGRHSTSLVFYAIENLDQVSKVRSKFPVPATPVRLVINAALRTVLSETSRAAFGTGGALDVYRKQLGERGWARATRNTEMALIPGLSAPTPPPDATPPSEPDLACFLGSFEERKGILEIIEAWPLVHSQRRASRLLIIGHGPLVDIVERFAADRGEVDLLIDPPRENIRDALARTHALVLPSRRTPVWREQIGLPILEALSAGCEIVTNTETGIAEWLEKHGHNVVPADTDPAGLALAIVDALESNRTRSEVQSNLPRVDGRMTADSWLFAG